MSVTVIFSFLKLIRRRQGRGRQQHFRPDSWDQLSSWAHACRRCCRRARRRQMFPVLRRCVHLRAIRTRNPSFRTRSPAHLGSVSSGSSWQASGSLQALRAGGSSLPGEAALPLNTDGRRSASRRTAARWAKQLGWSAYPGSRDAGSSGLSGNALRGRGRETRVERKKWKTEHRSRPQGEAFGGKNM